MQRLVGGKRGKKQAHKPRRRLGERVLDSRDSSLAKAGGVTSVVNQNPQSQKKRRKKLGVKEERKKSSGGGPTSSLAGKGGGGEENARERRRDPGNGRLPLVQAGLRGKRESAERD